jgi:hypothetical protein
VLTEWNASDAGDHCAEAAAAFDRADWLAAALATASSCCASSAAPTAAGTGRGRSTARRRHATRPSPPITPPRRRVHPARRGDRAGALDRGRLIEVADVLLDHFWDADHGGLFTTADDAERS